ERQTIQRRQTVIVSVPKARIEGLIASDKNLDKAEIRKDKGEWQALARFAAGKHKEFAIDESVSLEPGLNVFELRAASGKGKAEMQDSVPIEFRPRPPEIVLTAPAVIYDDGKGAGQVRVDGRLALNAAQHKRNYEAEVILNGKSLKDRPEVNGDRLTTRVPLTAGENAIQVKLTDGEKKWALSRTSERIIVRYLRPPRDIQIAKPNVAKAKKALTDITAQVNSIPKLVGVEAEINGRRITSESKAEDAGGGVWKVLLK